MGKEKHSDGYVARALDALKKNGGQVALKELAKAMGLKAITGPELGLLRIAVMSHPHVNVYLRSPDEGGRSRVMLELIEGKATVKEWKKTAYGKRRTQTSNETPRREAIARSERASQPGISLMSVKFGPRKEAAANAVDMLLISIKETVQQVNKLRDEMAKEMQQKEQQTAEILKRRKELIENARELKIEASQARKDASGLGKRLRKTDREISKVFSQARNAVRPRK
jgi:hypothetical protein